MRKGSLQDAHRDTSAPCSCSMTQTHFDVLPGGAKRTRICLLRTPHGIFLEAGALCHSWRLNKVVSASASSS